MGNDLMQRDNYKELDETINDIATQIVDESNIDTTKNLIDLFNWNLSKKNAIRLLNLYGIQDKVIDQMIERFSKRASEFSNNDLLNYLQTIENSIEKTSKGLKTSQEEAPQIQVNNNTQVNFNILDNYDSDSKSRIVDTIRTILKSGLENDNQEEQPTDLIYTEDTNNQEI